MDHDLVGLSVFLACLVEMVEALTIVLAIGTAREWRSTLRGAAAAIILLIVLVAIFGTALERIPQKWLWLVMGSLLLFFGVQWLRNAILRYSGIKPVHNEDSVFQEVKKEAIKEGKSSSAIDWYAFTIVFKGVFLEGLEVVFIVLAFCSSKGDYRLGVGAAIAAFILVALVGLIVHRPLAKVPENTMKFVAGLVLTTFGTYFGSQGLGIFWPHGNFAFLNIFVFYLLISLAIVIFLKSGGSRVDAKT